MENGLFQEIASGYVYHSPVGVDEVANNPRCAALTEGRIACSFTRQSCLGVNDFCPHLTLSDDGGVTWAEPRMIWPHLVNRLSCIGQVSAIPGTSVLLYFGVGFPVETPGETYWRADLCGLKQNLLIWARSDDGGENWTDPHSIPLPHPGSAEAQGPILVASDGAWVACYSPYRNWDPTAEVDVNGLMSLRSADAGRTWTFSRIMTFPEPESGAAEAWVAEYEKGALVASCWHTNLRETGGDYTNKVGLSQDGGITWSGPYDTGIHGQSTALLAIGDGRVLLLYNQRKEGAPGIRVAVLSCGAGLSIVRDEMLWEASRATRGISSGDHAAWTDFAFGEPALLHLEGTRFLLVFWEKESSGRAAISYRLLDSDV